MNRWGSTAMVPSILGLLIGGSKFGSLPVHGVLSLINSTVYSGRVSSAWQVDLGFPDLMSACAVSQVSPSRRLSLKIMLLFPSATYLFGRISAVGICGTT